MKAWMMVAALFGLALLVLPSLEAQDESKKADEKPPVKKAAPRPVTEDDVLKCAKTKGKILSNDEKSKEVTIATVEPLKENEFKEWDARTQADIAGAGNDALQRLAAYKQEYPKKYSEIFSGESKTIAQSPNLRVRTSFPPPQYDSMGNLKKASPADLSRLKAGSRLPGYLASLSNLRAGQIVDVYVPKAAPAPKQSAPAKKDFVGGDASLTTGPMAGKLDAYFIYVAIDAQ